MSRSGMQVATTFCATSVLVLGACGKAAITRDVVAGSTWVVDSTTELSQLTIGQGAAVRAPAGRNLTFTVDGVETPLLPGTYRGHVVITPTDTVTQRFNDMGVDETYQYRSAVYVEDGARVPGKSVASAVTGGTVSDQAATNVVITSRGDKFNGFFITGNSTYSIVNPKLDLTGNGGNDFAGFGAGIKTAGNARVTIEHANIVTQGVVRTAVFVGGNSIVTVNDSNIEVHNGTLPADYLGGPITGKGGVMMEPPWTLGVVGNVRATNVVENGTVYYNNSHIRSQGWGALSTDATTNVKLYATKSVIETVESGYGAYADGTSLDTFSGCTFNVVDYGLIMTGGSGVFTDGTVVNSRRFGVMMHSGGSGTLTIDKGSVFNTGAAVIQVKSSYPRIVIDDAKLNSGSGVLIEAIVNDDPYAAGFGAGIGPGGGAGRAGGPPGGGRGGPAGPDGPGAPGGRGGPAGGPVAGPRLVSASLSNASLSGDIVNSMSTLAGMNVTLENTTLRGAVSTATAAPAQAAPTAATFREIGNVRHTLRSTDAVNGLALTVGKGSSWVPGRTSYLTALTIADGSTVAAPAGRTLSMTVDGRATPIVAGSYRGAIVVQLSN